jgi:hypothetical protein
VNALQQLALPLLDTRPGLLEARLAASRKSNHQNGKGEKEVLLSYISDHPAHFHSTGSQADVSPARPAISSPCLGTIVIKYDQEVVEAKLPENEITTSCRDPSA